MMILDFIRLRSLLIGGIAGAVIGFIGVKIGV
jgi:hypothetical protein